MKRPAFQFYPADWQANIKLRRCTHAEKGVWIDVMCLMHDSEAYGILRWTMKEIAQAVGCPVALLKKLRTRDVLKGAEPGQTCDPLIYVPRSARKNGDAVTLVSAQAGPIWYSSRMVVDEYKRVHSGGSTRFKARQGEGESEDEEEDSGDTAPGPTSSLDPSPCPSPSQRQGEPQGDSPCRRRSDGATSTSTSSIKTLSVPNGTDTGASPCAPSDMTKDELWTAGKSLLSQAGMPLAQCGSLIGKLCKDYGDAVAIDAVRTAVVQRPADPASFLVATCQQRTRRRSQPNRQEALEARNREIAARLAAELTGAGA